MYPRAAALDLKPEHILGQGLEILSVSQLSALEYLHEHWLREVRDARVRRLQRENADLANQVAFCREELSLLRFAVQNLGLQRKEG